MKCATILLFLLSAFLGYSQNLIPNPSFEDTLRTSANSYSAKNWISPTQGSPDYLSPFNLMVDSAPQNNIGYQVAKSGIAYRGINIYSLYRNINTKRFREYIQSKFKSPMIQDTTYCLQFFLNLADSCRFASRNQFGVYLSNNRISSTTRYELQFTPQIIVSPSLYITDKQNWLQFDFKYKANGGEEYITLGNFNDTLGLDTIHVGGGIDPQFQNTYYYIDDVYLGSCDNLPYVSTVGVWQNKLSKKNINLYPNPFTNEFYMEVSQTEGFSFQLYNGIGQKVELKVQREANRYIFSVGNLPIGLYYLRTTSTDEQTTIKLLKN